MISATQLKTLLLSTLATSAVMGFCATSVSAHDDDGKIRDRQKPYKGKAWHEGDPIDGVAGTFDSSNIQLKSWLPLNTLNAGSANANSCWGHIYPNGHEYAIIGLNTGTAFVNITNPAAASLTAFMVGPTSLWRDVRTHGNFCYAASEGGSGIQVFDISRLDSHALVTLSSTILAPTTTTAATHTLAIDNASGYLYRAGGGSSGLRMYNLNNTPGTPEYVGQWSNIYIHECQVITYTTGVYAGRQIAFCCGGANGGYANTGLYIVDVTNKAIPIQMGFAAYPGGRYCHQGWLDAEGKYFYINDELDEGDTVTVTTTIVIDVQNLAAPVHVNSFDNGNPAIGHNLFVKGNLLYEANYRSGFRVFDLAVDRLDPPEIAYFDTYPGSDSANFNGLWNIWPFFPSGTVIGSDIERGLFVWTVGGPVATFALTSAAPAMVNPNGGSTVDLTMAAGAGHTLNAASAVMKTTSSGNTVSTPLSPLGGTAYRATFPATVCPEPVTYTFEVADTLGELSTDITRTTLSAVGFVTAADHPFEAAAGWTGGVAGDTAVSGAWVRVDPVGTTAQPEDDHSSAGAQCWVTGNGAVGGAAGSADVDTGYTTLLSPNFDLSALSDPTISCWVWYSNNLGGAPNADSMPIEISNNGGTSWVLLEDYAANNSLWTVRNYRVSDFVTPTATVRVRFVARDLGTGSLVEAGVDDFLVTDIDCGDANPADLNGDGVVNASDLSILLSAWGGTSGPADINDSGTIDAVDLALLMGAWNG